MTKPTNEERREVAIRVRRLVHEKRPTVDEFYKCLVRAVMSTWDYYCPDDLINRLADLIEPPFPPCEETEEWLDSIKREGQPKTVREVIEDIIWTCSTVDIGPNGNVFSGVDEGIVSTNALISTWETQLADLIEPEPERTCWNKAVRNNKEFPPEYRTDNFICSACGALFFADSEYINHPIDWAFCPDCGAKVVDE